MSNYFGGLVIAFGLLASTQLYIDRGEYEIATPGVDDHVAYRLDKSTGEVCRIDFYDKTVRCGAELDGALSIIDQATKDIDQATKDIDALTEEVKGMVDELKEIE